jgi:hypothetical protein
MTRARIAGWAFGAVLVLFALASAGYWAFDRYGTRAAARSPAIASISPAIAPTSPSTTPSTAAATPAEQGFLYGRITTVDGATYEGRLRWGRGEEAFWGDYFNGRKGKNPWAAHVPPERLPKTRPTIEILGIEIPQRQRPVDLARLFMARFGDIARIGAQGRDVRVTLKSGTVFDLDRLEASDFDDGVRVWDGRRRVVNLDSLRIRTIELLPTARLGEAPNRLHGTVRTRHGDFTGFVQWNREEGVGSDQLDGRVEDQPLGLRFDTVHSIARRSADSVLVTLLDGREVVLSDSREIGQDNRGTYVDDRRYGRVLISWDAFERVDFTPGGSGPAYGDFPRGQPLTGTVTTRDGRRLAGRLVYDLDESETTETLDAPSQGVDYTIPFGLVASIVPVGGGKVSVQHASVTLHDGEELLLERTGDLGAGNAGMMIFVDDGQRPEYVPWNEVEQVDFDRPPAMYPPLGGREQIDDSGLKSSAREQKVSPP